MATMVRKTQEQKSIGFHYGTLPPIGARVRWYHPWLEDGLVGTVVRYEKTDDMEFDGHDDGEPVRVKGRYHVHLTDVLTSGRNGMEPGTDTSMNNLSASWQYETERPTE